LLLLLLNSLLLLLVLLLQLQGDGLLLGLLLHLLLGLLQLLSGEALQALGASQVLAGGRAVEELVSFEGVVAGLPGRGLLRSWNFTPYFLA